VLARRPLDGLVGHNVLTHGTALDIEGCRVDPNSSNTGRWPPNMLLVHHPECQQVGTRRVKTGTAVRKNGKGGQFFGQPTPKLAGPSADVSFGKDGYEEIPEWRCHPQCPVRAIDDQSGTLKSGDSPGFVGDVAHSQSMGSKVAMIRPESTYGDMGGASRFFPTFHYAAKASKTERNAGCDDLPERDDRGTRNHHPTLKPLAVMRWLVRLVTPMPDPVVLDCFMGSGTCGLACAYEGASYIGIEKDPDYYAIARARIEWSWGRIHEATPSTPDRPEPAANQQDLFR
jgi:site-specific DNA-methyltransferase (adenine-specific)